MQFDKVLSRAPSNGEKAVMISSFSGTFTGRFPSDGLASMTLSVVSSVAVVTLSSCRRCVAVVACPEERQAIRKKRGENANWSSQQSIP